MKAVEFEKTVNKNGQIFLPADLASTDAAWREAGRHKFEEAYCAADAVYEQLTRLRLKPTRCIPVRA